MTPLVEAVTVVVWRHRDALRVSPAEREFLLARRSPDLNFMPGFHVFPGGKCEESDAIRTDSKSDWVSQASNALSFARLPDPWGKKSLSTILTAALREIHEECNLNLVEYGDASSVKSLSVWRTPKESSRRFDTLFLSIRVSESATIKCDGKEIVDAFWLTSDEAILLNNSGEIFLAPPTRATLEDIDGLLAPLEDEYDVPLYEPIRTLRESSVYIDLSQSTPPDNDPYRIGLEYQSHGCFVSVLSKG